MSSALSYALGGVAAVATFLVARAVLGSSARRAMLPDCSTAFSAVHRGGTRDASRGGPIRMIVIHSTEGDTAGSAAGWFADSRSGGSTQYVVDDDACYAPLPESVVPWGAEGCDANVGGVHIEIAGYARWSRDEWLALPGRIDKAAAIVADVGRRYGIPIRRLSPGEIRSGGAAGGVVARGIATHAEITAACGIAGGHTDPGEGFPMDRLIAIARAS